MIDGGLHKEFKKYMPSVHWVRIETLDVAPGTPDLNGCYGGVEIWIENKRTTGNKVSNMRVAQVGWMEQRARKGGRVFIAVRQQGKAGVGRTAKLRDTLWLFSWKAARPLIDGKKLGDFNQGLLLVSSGGPAKWDWISISETLFPPPFLVTP
jgi:hypothetical protein